MLDLLPLLLQHLMCSRNSIWHWVVVHLVAHVAHAPGDHVATGTILGGSRAGVLGSSTQATGARKVVVGVCGPGRVAELCPSRVASSEALLVVVLLGL
jgi:hypothetical protein